MAWDNEKRELGRTTMAKGGQRRLRSFVLARDTIYYLLKYVYNTIVY